MTYLVMYLLLFVVLYLILFDSSKYNTLFITLYGKVHSGEYDKIDRRKQYNKHVKEKKCVEFFIKYKLLSQKKFDYCCTQLKVAGIFNPEQYIGEYIINSPMLLVVGVLFLVGSKVFRYLLYIVFNEYSFLTSIMYVFGIVLCIGSVFSIALLPKVAHNMKKKAIKEIEDDYPKLFNHIYYYYVSSGRTYLLSDVLSKLSANLNSSTTSMVNIIIEDCKSSEIIALQNVKSRYSESIKIVNLADKLQRCVEGYELGPEYLRGLHEQMIAEEDLSRQRKEERKTSLYTLAMMVCMLLMVAISCSGLLLQYMIN